MSDLFTKLWDLIAEKFRGSDDFYGIKRGSKWGSGLRVRLYNDRDISITAKACGEVEVSIDLERVRSEIEKVLRFYKYDRMFEEAKTDEEKERIDQELRVERDAILDSFKLKMFEGYFDRDVAYLAKKYAWADEVARRMSEKYGFEVKFEVLKPEAESIGGGERQYSSFNGIVDLSNMGEEQAAHEVMRAIDAVLGAREMYRNDKMMNEFLVSRGIEPSPVPKIYEEKPENIARDIAGKLRDLIFERFKGEERLREIELSTLFLSHEWRITVEREPQGLAVTVYKDGKVMVGASKIPTSDELFDYLYRKKYGCKCKEAKTEKDKIFKEIDMEEDRIIEDFREERFDKYLKGKKGDIAYYAKRHMWAHEVARRVSRKYNVKVKFNVDVDSIFTSIFDSTGMSEEQIIKETMKRVDALAEADEMLWNKEMMDEFLISKGIEPMSKLRHRKS